MQIKAVKPEQVDFDPVEGTFTALVTLWEGEKAYRYPCHFEAPMMMPLSIAAHRLTQMAKQQHIRAGGLRSIAPHRAGSTDPNQTGPDQADLPRVA